MDHSSTGVSRILQTTIFYNVFYVIVLFLKKIEVAKAVTPAGKAIAEDPAGTNFPEETEALPAESVHLEPIRASLYDLKQQSL
ncbi:hypothetical protein CR203_12130 [Salipaludibacillus neizhouensis]|uniref:Uncharacterized protein n=1 Tax=Salipaludibacillus neizhouensis TaxID=885475 RepID=A0A3A9K4J6_9BACI|nr:hypothetical protein [Salipaludibacillus neizhouensis]RKL67249.1 hypothetical protein CR203_12130 [Salipaludibacillus neizhouensis]